MLKPLDLGSNALGWYHERSHAGIPQDAGWIIGQAGSVQEGTLVRMGLLLARERVTEARYEVFGCPATIAAAAWLVSRMSGAVPSAITELDGRSIAEALRLPVEKTGVALVVEDALRAALEAAATLAGSEQSEKRLRV